MAKPKVVITREPPGPALSRVFEECDAWMWEEDSTISRELLLDKVRDAEGLHVMMLDQINDLALQSPDETAALVRKWVTASE